MKTPGRVLGLLGEGFCSGIRDCHPTARVENIMTVFQQQYCHYNCQLHIGIGSEQSFVS